MVFKKGQVGYNKGKMFSIETKRKMSEKGKLRVGNLNPFFGKHHSPETIKRISQSNLGKPGANLGKKFSLVSRIRMSNSQKGNIPWNKGTKGLQVGLKGRVFSPSTIIKMSQSAIERIKSHPTQFIKGNKFSMGRSWNRNQKMNQTTGEKHWNWKGGINPQENTLRNSIEWKQWRRNVFKRDNYTCRFCHKQGCIQAHHVIPISIDKSRIFDVINGVTLCKPCHFDKYLGLHEGVKHTR